MCICVTEISTYDLYSALIGASLFISTVVFGSVILLSEVSRKTISECFSLGFN